MLSCNVPHQPAQTQPTSCRLRSSSCFMSYLAHCMSSRSTATRQRQVMGIRSGTWGQWARTGAGITGCWSPAGNHYHGCKPPASHQSVHSNSLPGGTMAIRNCTMCQSALHGVHGCERISIWLADQQKSTFNWSSRHRRTGQSTTCAAPRWRTASQHSSTRHTAPLRSKPRLMQGSYCAAAI